MMNEELKMDESDKLIYDTIRNTLTEPEQKLFDRTMEDEQHKIGSIGQLVSEGLRRREKLGYFD